MSSEASITSVAPSRAFTSALAMMCSSGKERPTFVAGEQNWQPRPQPRVISQTPTMPDDRNLFDRRLHVFRNFDDAWQCRVARQDSSKQLGKDALDLAIDQVVDLEFVEPVCLFELPRARTTNDDARLKLLDHRMFHDPDELVRVHGHQVFAGEF
jgi:hypothetical protein